MKTFSLCCSLLLLAGCSFAPKYQRPALPVPAVYKEKGPWHPAKPASAAVNRGPWWTVYRDPILNKLEAKIICSNQNLQAAVGRFDEARSILAEQRAAYFPSIVGIFNAYRLDTSRNVANAPVAGPVWNDKYLGLNATYEVDVWGRVRNAVSSARSLAAASAADLAALDLSLHAELAMDYFTLRGDDIKLRILNETVRVYAKQLYLIKQRYQGGASPVGDLDQAESQYEAAKTAVADMRLQRAEVEHAIAVLIGEPPALFSLAAAKSSFYTVTITPSLPSTLLERRPDIAEAEYKVQAANANIGVARAAFFPAVNLSAGLGFESAIFGNLLSRPSLTWALGPTTASALAGNGNLPLVTQTIFDGGLLSALSQQAQAQYLQTVANYRQTVLTAFQEVEDNLAAIRQLDKENSTQSKAYRAANRAVNQSLYRYKGGLTTYLDVVVLQNTALQTELSSADIKTRRQLASVKLIKALGGGYG
jgi:NodT family efflux transporter outer membrane factor (OMF) lipoprotein